MRSASLEERYQSLNNRLRILMLQNIREEAISDEAVLRELCNISGQLLELKKKFRTSAREGAPLPAGPFLRSLIS